MKIVIFGDAHGNIYALNKLLETETDADLFVCLGDLVGYGPHNDQCIDAIRSVEHVYLKGNHEEMFIDGKYHDSCSDIAKKFFTRSYLNYTKSKSVGFLSSLPSQYQLGDYVCTHTLQNRHIYPDTDLDELRMQGSYVIGHSHIQFKKSSGGLSVVNVGSLGQNRINVGVGEFAVYETSSNSIIFKNIKDISIDKFIDDLHVYGYEEELIEYYKNKM